MPRSGTALRRPGQSGQSLILVLVTCSILAVLVGAVVRQSQGTTSGTARDARGDVALQAADAGVSRYVSRLVTDPLYWSHYVDQAEDTRLDPTDGNRAYPPGSAWPAGKTTWTYSTNSWTDIQPATDRFGKAQYRLRITPPEQQRRGDHPVRRPHLGIRRQRPHASGAGPGAPGLAGRLPGPLQHVDQLRLHGDHDREDLLREQRHPRRHGQGDGLRPEPGHRQLQLPGRQVRQHDQPHDGAALPLGRPVQPVHRRPGRHQDHRHGRRATCSTTAPPRAGWCSSPRPARRTSGGSPRAPPRASPRRSPRSRRPSATRPRPTPRPSTTSASCGSRSPW